MQHTCKCASYQNCKVLLCYVSSHLCAIFNLNFFVYTNSYLSCCIDREIRIELSFNNTVIYEPEVITTTMLGRHFLAMEDGKGSTAGPSQRTYRIHGLISAYAYFKNCKEICA